MLLVICLIRSFAVCCVCGESVSEIIIMRLERRRKVSGWSKEGRILRLQHSTTAAAAAPVVCCCVEIKRRSWSGFVMKWVEYKRNE
jgi:hypothetical protein